MFQLFRFLMWTSAGNWRFFRTMFRFFLILMFWSFPPHAYAQPADEVRAVVTFFERIQQLSFANDREYCGYVGWDVSGELTFTPPVIGRTDGCTPIYPSDDLTVFASYHTHGSFDVDVPAEFPTILDMESDEEEGIDGYIATPGGRLWYVDSEAMEVYQICSIGCILQDPAFMAGLDGTIETDILIRR